FVAISDLLDLTALDPVVNDAVEQMADQGALTLDTLVRDELTAGADATNVIYAAGTTRTGIATTDKLTSVLLRKAVRALKKAKTPMFSGSGGRPHYIAIVGPDTTYDLQDDASWKAVAEYQDKEAIYSGEIGRLYGVRIIETTESKIFAAAGAGTPKADIAATLVIGKDAYGIIDVGGDGAVKTIVHPCGSAGTADPLDQVSTVGWKVPAFTCRILMPERIVRIEHGVSA
ncbi:MAG: N4-gp56 family major capsid protein, partial [Clostridia bacterium]